MTCSHLFRVGFIVDRCNDLLLLVHPGSHKVMYHVPSSSVPQQKILKFERGAFDMTLDQLRFSTFRAHGDDVGLCYRDSSQCTSANGGGRALQWPLDAGNCGLLLVSPGYKTSLIVWWSGIAMA